MRKKQRDFNSSSVFLGYSIGSSVKRVEDSWASPRGTERAFTITDDQPLDLKAYLHMYPAAERWTWIVS